MDVNMKDPEIAEVIERLVGGPPAKDGEVMRMGDSSHAAASQFDHMLRGWQASAGSPDADILPEKRELDIRHRDARRNDGFVQSSENQHKDSIVGAMYLCNSKPATEILLGSTSADDQWEAEFQEEIETKFMLAANSTSNWFDASGTFDFTGLIRLAMGVAMASGEIIATAEWDRDRARPFKTCVQLVEGDRLETPWQYKMDANVRGGVRVNALGRAIGMYIQNKHPGDIQTGWMPDDYKYVEMNKPWGRKQGILLRDPRRPGQTRCVSDLVAGLKELRVSHRFRDIMLENAITNGMFAASIESELPTEVIAAQLKSPNDHPGMLAANYAGDYMAAVMAYAGSSRGLKLDGVRIPHLFPGTKLNLTPAGSPGGVGSEFEVALLRYLAATVGLSYEEFSRDFSKTNYSSIKAAINTTYRYQQTRKKLFADTLANIIFALWFEEQMNAGNLETMKYSRLPNFYDGMNREAYTRTEWIGADFGQIDELKETQASVLKIKNNLSTYEAEFGRRGKDWRKQFRQIAKEKQYMEELEITPLDQDPNMMNAASGSGREPDSSNGEGNTNDA